jgi:hypothetical protein
VNKDAYVQPEPLERAKTAQIYNQIQDADGKPVLTVNEIRQAERLADTTPVTTGGPVG